MTKSTFYAAALSALLLQFQVGSSSARQPRQLAFAPPHRQHQQLCSSASSCTSTSRSSTAIDDFPSDSTMDIEIESDSSVTGSGGDPESILQSRNRLLALSETLASNSPSGKFISRPSDKIKLQKAINDLEALVSSPGEREKDMMLGDWTLVATANLPSSDMRRRFDSKDSGSSDSDSKKKGWFKKNNGKKKQRSGLSMFGREGRELNPIQKSIRKTLSVTQRIRSIGTDGMIDRVDNVINITPLDTLEDIIPTESPLFNLLGNVNVNPLQVKKSKVVLVHKAEVESVAPVLRTKIALTSSILNVAGTSQYFDPEGADLFGVNIPFGEFTNVGTFDTPFVDEDIRVSRTSGPVLEQLRVFVRQGSSLSEDSGMLDSLTAEMRVEEEKEVANSDDVGTQVKKVVDAATSMAENARSTIEKDMEDVSTALGDTMDDVAARVQDVVEDDLEQIRDAVEEVQSAIQDGDKISEAVSNVTKAVAKVPSDVLEIVEEDALELGDKVEEVLDNMVADVQDSVEADLKEIGDTIEEIRDAATGDETDGEKEKDETKDESE